MRLALTTLAALLLVPPAEVRAAALALSSPQERQVVQRSPQGVGAAPVAGVLTAAETPPAGAVRELRARLGGEWRTLDATWEGAAFRASFAAPAGPWRKLEVRVVDVAGGKETVVAEAAVEHVGVGEVFVVAGQSNSANHGAERQRPKSGMVSTFDGKSWRLADDPQPGASGDGGSFLPPLGDLLAEKFRVPIGFASCGVGATSVREWLPQGDRFPYPPTLRGRVEPSPDGGWESKGAIYPGFVARMQSLGVHGFRAVLWHQGESDANQQDPACTLPGKLYAEYLTRLIEASRKEIGWAAPWFVAQASYHSPNDVGSEELRSAQASLAESGLALAGPDSDALRGGLRDGGGKGVHFSGEGLREHAARWFEKIAPWIEKRQAADVDDPFAAHLDGRPPEVLREIPLEGAPPAGVSLRQVVFRSRDGSEIFAVVATPSTAAENAKEKLPGILVLHGGGGSAEVDKAVAWAQRGYVAVAPDLPGIGEPKKLLRSKGKWSGLKYGEGRYVAEPDAGASVLVDAVLAAMKSLYLLKAQPQVDPQRIGVVGVSWGGYMTTMVCGLAGEQVRAGFSVYGCGFYELTSQQATLAKMPPAERDRWLRGLDAGRRAAQIEAPFFLAAAANDFFFLPPAVHATLAAIPGEKNHVYAPNANHKIPLPGGSVFAKGDETPFIPTPFQPFPTPSGSKANWLAMEVPFFELHLKGEGLPFPKAKIVPGADLHGARFTVEGPRPPTKAEVFFSPNSLDWGKRVWTAVPTERRPDGIYQATLPAEAAGGGDWFAVVSDDRPVTVSSDLVHVGPKLPFPK